MFACTSELIVTALIQAVSQATFYNGQKSTVLIWSDSIKC